MGSSRSFAPTANDMRPIQTWFPYGSGPEGLNLNAADGNSPDHYAKGTPSRIASKLAIALRPLVGTWFQVQYPPLAGVLPIFQSPY